jgi:hypothetical protein
MKAQVFLLVLFYKLNLYLYLLKLYVGVYKNPTIILNIEIILTFYFSFILSC